MVKDVLFFYEVVCDIVEFIEGVIFVVYNVCFDYGFLWEEYKCLGYIYMCKQLCMVCMLCKVFFGFFFYSFENFICYFNILMDVCYCVLVDVRVIIILLECILECK